MPRSSTVTTVIRSLHPRTGNTIAEHVDRGFVKGAPASGSLYPPEGGTTPSGCATLVPSEKTCSLLAMYNYVNVILNA